VSLQTLTTPEQAVAFLRARVTGTLQTDSRLVAPGDAFIAWPGAATDGRAHVAGALARGAVACLVEQEGVEPYAFAGPHIAALRGLKAATGLIAAEWFGHPTQSLQVLAVTGTNGKTSSACWLADAVQLLSKNELPALAGCALVGTLGIGVPPRLESTGMTTPDPVRLQRAFRAFVDQGLGYCAIEASSIGVAEQRLAGTRIRVAVFTNFTQDHLDYHGSMEAYWQAKAALFDTPGLQAAVVNTMTRRARACTHSSPRARSTCGATRCTAPRGCRPRTLVSARAACALQWPRARSANGCRRGSSGTTTCPTSSA